MSKSKKTKAQKKADKWFKEMMRKRNTKKPKGPRIVKYHETPVYLIGPSDCSVTSVGHNAETSAPAHGSIIIGSPYEK